MSARAGPSNAVGVDVIEIERVEAALAKFGERFLRRVYTREEAAFCRGRVHELAARFAAKEAVMKALGTGAKGVAWREIEVLPNHRGKPLVYLYGRAKARAERIGLGGRAGEEVPARGGEPVEALRRWRELGILGSAAMDGFGPEDLARAQLTQLGLRRGVPLEAIAKAFREGLLAWHSAELTRRGRSYPLADAAEMPGSG